MGKCMHCKFWGNDYLKDKEIILPGTITDEIPEGVRDVWMVGSCDNGGAPDYPEPFMSHSCSKFEKRPPGKYRFERIRELNIEVPDDRGKVPDTDKGIVLKIKGRP